MQNAMSLTSHVTIQSLMYDAKCRHNSRFEGPNTKARHRGIIYSFTIENKEHFKLDIEVVFS